MLARKWKVLNKLEVHGSRFTVQKIIGAILENRDIKTKKEKEEFLNPRLEDVTMQNVGIKVSEVKKTIARIRSAIDKNEKIVIFGDYDVDGICGTAILWETLFKFTKNVIPYIPHRVDEGYGLSLAGISNIKNQISKTGLIITVDNGIVVEEAVEFAKKNGFDVIITDHHVPGKKLPRAFSIVHTTKLCGTGVAYLLAQEILNPKSEIRNKSKIPNNKFETVESHLELVALATVADLVPLTGANRALVKFGIEKLRKTKRPGLLALFDEAQIKSEEIDVYKIGHIIAPRLNASGRITHAMDSLRLICTKDPVRAKKLAQTLSEINQDRRLLTEEAAAHADLIAESGGKIIFVSDAGYNQGVIGLVASRLVEKHYKPSLVVSIGEKFSKGSARSVAGFNIIGFLREFSIHLIDAGGHPMAAGFTIETAKIELFKDALVRHAEKVLDTELLERILKIDLELEFDSISDDMLDAIQKLSPFGMGNPEPVFMSRTVQIENIRKVGREGNHLKLILKQGNKVFDAILFGSVDSELRIGDKVDLAYVINEDNWNGSEKIQLKIRDIKEI